MCVGGGGGDNLCPNLENPIMTSPSTYMPILHSLWLSIMRQLLRGHNVLQSMGGGGGGWSGEVGQAIKRASGMICHYLNT